MRRQIGRLLEIGDALVHIREDGDPDGKPLLLVHGFSGSMHWYDQIVPLLGERRVIRLDLLGHGSTGGEPVDAPKQAEMVAEVLRTLGAGEVTAVGHSFGADVVLALADQSDLVDGLVLIAQAPDYVDARFPKGNFIMTWPVIGGVLHRWSPAVIVRRVATWAFAPGFRHGAAFDKQVVEDSQAMHVGMFGVILRDRAERMKHRPLDAQVKEIGLPTLVILGERDRFYGARSQGRYLAAGARVEVLADAGHSPMVEEPEVLARLITS